MIDKRLTSNTEILYNYDVR